ncbi:MAG: phosphoglucosamine mutase [Armatimonadetes bacterium]|nr:phosphoglucosamine mutase [Armatimonadota bacterium]
MSRLFGTDGLRGRANATLSPELAVRVGLAAGRVLNGGRAGTVVLGRDTRQSGPMLEAAVAAGLSSAGWRVRLAGIMPSPGVACLTTLLGADAGCVISASHNPAPDNGIKFFSAAGAKLTPDIEDRIEALLSEDAAAAYTPRPAPGPMRRLSDSARRYAGFLRGTLEGRDLRGVRLVVDCANGAASRVAPHLFRSLGAEVVALACGLDGRSINDGCGATHPRPLAQAVVRERADAGVAFDGDADRAIFVDERGVIRNGDHVMYLIATRRLAAGRLPGATVVGTVMTNLGTERALAAAGIRLERAKVGDREVYARMGEVGAVLGGEQSGHIIFRDLLNTGDGLLTALLVLDAVRGAGRPLSELCAPVTMFPQVLINIPLHAGLDWRDGTPLGQALGVAQVMVRPDGRAVIRPSGTEPILRVMLESPEASVLAAAADRIEAVVPLPGVRRHFLSTTNEG